ncbi:MAG: phytoene desaturase family protein [Dehalococcoidia bacterium]
MINKKEIFIVGGGLGGIAASIYLSKSGWNVTLLEKNKSLGGKLNRFEKNGFIFDTGPSLITLPNVFEDLFNCGNKSFYEELKPVKINPLFQYRFPSDKIMHYSTNIDELSKEVEKITGDKEEVRRLYKFFEHGAKIYNFSDETFLNKSPYNRPKISEIIKLLRAPKRFTFSNYSNMINKFFKSKELQQLFNRYPTYVGSSPYESVAMLSIIPYIEIAMGGWYIPGGLYKIIENLEKIAISLGVNIIKNVEISKIGILNNKIKYLESKNNEKFNCENVIFNCDPYIVKNLIPNNAKKMKEHENLSMSGFIMLVGLRKKIKNIHHHTVCFSDDYFKEFEQIIIEKKFPDDPTVYINIPSITDKKVAPNGCETVFIMANAPATNEIWDNKKINNTKNKIIRRITRSKIDNFMNDVEFIKYITPNTFAKKYNAPNGSIYGQISHGWKKTFLRPNMKDKKIDGVYYVGGGTHPGGGTPMVIKSAKIISELLNNNHD